MMDEHKNFPTLCLNSMQYPELLGMELNDETEIQITVKVKGIRKAEGYDLPTVEASEGGMAKNNVIVGDFQIIDVQPVEKTEKEEAEDYEKKYADLRGGIQSLL